MSLAHKVITKIFKNLDFEKHLDSITELSKEINYQPAYTNEEESD